MNREASPNHFFPAFFADGVPDAALIFGSALCLRWKRSLAFRSLFVAKYFVPMSERAAKSGPRANRFLRSGAKAAPIV